MSKMKKVISLVLCIAMLAGTFTFLGDLIVPSAEAAGTSQVKTFAEVDAAYDDYIYLGLDVIEVANGELTDGYVNAGDWLEYHMTVLSDFYVGNTAPVFIYDRNFFDVRVVTSNTPSTSATFEKADYEGNKKFADGTFMNADHPVAPQNGEIASYNTLTAFPYGNVATQLGFCEIDATTYQNWDFVKTNLGVTSSVTNTNFLMQTDEWITSWYVRVKEGLADGTTGQSFTLTSIYKNQINPSTGTGDNRRIGDIYTADALGTYASAKAMNVRYKEIKNLLVEDCTHTFTIGEKPAGEEPEDPEIKKYEVKFLALDGSEIAKAELAEGEAIAAPAVENLLGWVDSTGKLVEVAAAMGTKALTYTAVLTTDKFDVKVALGGGTYAAAPEGTTVDGDNLIIKAGLGETVDLSAIALPEKDGYAASWPSATVKVESIKGVNIRLTWTVETYNAAFYLDKAAYEAGAEALVNVSFQYVKDMTAPFAQAEVSIKNLKPDMKFAGWKNAATGESVDKSAKFAEDVAFYADWTNYNSSVVIWGRDYENGGWKEIATKYGDAGTTVKVNDLKAYVTEANYGTAAAQYVVAGKANTFSNETAIRADFAMVEGKTDVYLFTTTKFDVTFKTPVLDAEGYITEEYNSKTESFVSSHDDSFRTAKAVAATPEAHTGYEFKGWKDAEGNLYAPGNIALDYANGTAYEFTAEYQLVEYSIEFAIDNSSDIKEIYKVEGKFKAGDKFTLSEMTFVKEDGTEGILPEIGKENKEQAGGPYRNVNGKKFAGWKAGAQAANLVDYDITQEIVLTPDIIKTVALGSKITIKGFWEALPYDFVVYYAKSMDAEGKPVYEAMPAIKVNTGASLSDAYAAALEIVNANLPEGKRFSLWRTADGSNIPNNMPAYGAEVYATYVGKPLALFIDYNNGAELNSETWKPNGQLGKYLFDGVDVVNDIPGNEAQSIDGTIRSSTIPDGARPSEKHELVGWKVFYVVNEADAYDKSKWNEGFSDVEGSTIAKYTLIYQAQWMAHKDFFFRVVNTDGNLRSAIDWKFNTYFWYNRKPATKETAEPLNHLPDRLLMLGFLPIPEFEDGLSIKVQPITISKAWLNPANWGELLKALWNGITSGFGGAL